MEPLFFFFFCFHSLPVCALIAESLSEAVWITHKPGGVRRMVAVLLSPFSHCLTTRGTLKSLIYSKKKKYTELCQEIKMHFESNTFQQFNPTAPPFRKMWRLEYGISNKYLQECNILLYMRRMCKGCWQFVFVSGVFLWDSGVYIPEAHMLFLCHARTDSLTGPTSPPHGANLLQIIRIRCATINICFFSLSLSLLSLVKVLSSMERLHTRSKLCPLQI